MTRRGLLMQLAAQSGGHPEITAGKLMALESVLGALAAELRERDPAAARAVAERLGDLKPPVGVVGEGVMVARRLAQGHNSVVRRIVKKLRGG